MLKQCEYHEMNWITVEWKSEKDYDDDDDDNDDWK